MCRHKVQWLLRNWTKQNASGCSGWCFKYTPLNTWRNDPVVITSKRRHFDVITSKWRRFDAITTSLLRNVSAHSLQLPVTPSRSTLEVGWEDIALTNGAKKYVTTAKNKKVELANVREALKANNYSEWVHHLPPVTTERMPTKRETWQDSW